LYTPTDARACQPAHEEPGLDLELMVALFQPQQPTDGCPPKSKADQEEPKTLPVLQGIHQYLAEANHLLLVGRPGLGKSTVLLRLLVEQAQSALRDPAAKIPVLLELRYLDAHQPVVLDRIEAFLQNHNLNVEEAALKAALAAGRFLLLIDGVNELPSESARRAVDCFRRDYSQSQMVFTTRDVALGGDLGIANKLEMQLLSEAQIQQFIRAYLPAQERSMLQQLQGRARELGKTPLFLEMFCQVFAKFKQIPANLGLLFQCFVGGYEKLKQNVPTSEGFCYWKSDLLRHLAFTMLKAGKPTDLQVSISKLEAEAILTEFLQGKVDYPAQRAKEWLEDLLEHHLIQLATSDQLEFHHQLIQEYYAAEYLLRCLPKLDNEVLKRDYLNYLKWTEPVALMLALVEEEAQALRVVRLAMDEVDLMLGARLAGAVKPALQATTVGWIDQKELPIELKVRCWGASHSEESMPGILSALSNSETNVRERVLEALEAIGGEKAVDGLLLLINDLDHGTCGRAVAALGRLGNERAIKNLIFTLSISNRYPRTMAQIALKKMGTRKVVDELLVALQESDSDIREQVVEILGEIGGEVALSGLLAALHDSNSKVRRKSVKYLGRLDGKRFIDILMTMMQDSDPDVRRQLVNVLGSLGGELITDFLIAALQDSDPSVRQETVKYLGRIGDERATDALMSSVKDLDECSYWTLLEVFAPTIGDDIVDVLLSDLSSSKPYTRGRAAELLGIINSEEAVDGLLSALYDSDQYVYRRAAIALGRIGNEKAVDGLLLTLESSNNDLRRSAVSALGEIGTEKAMNGLLPSLSDPDANIRLFVVYCLGENAGEKELDGLLNALEDVDSTIRGDAAMWLGRANSRKAVDSLLLTLKDPEEFVRGNSAWALAKIGSEKAIDDLLAAFDDSSIWVRTQAAEGIGNIGDPQLLTTLWEYQLTSFTTETCLAIANIQNRCQFYNYELWQAAKSISTQPQPTNMTEKSEKQAPIININLKDSANLTFVQGDQNVDGGNVGTKNIYNYFGADPALNQEISDLQQFIANLEATNPNLETEQEADQIVTTALDQVQTQEPTRWQKIRSQMGILKKQILNPERHFQAAKATGIEVAKHYAENSLIVKAVITYIDKLSEPPDQGA